MIESKLSVWTYYFNISYVANWTNFTISHSEYQSQFIQIVFSSESIVVKVHSKKIVYSSFQLGCDRILKNIRCWWFLMKTYQFFVYTRYTVNTVRNRGFLSIGSVLICLVGFMVYKNLLIFCIQMFWFRSIFREKISKYLWLIFIINLIILKNKKID